MTESGRRIGQARLTKASLESDLAAGEVSVGTSRASNRANAAPTPVCWSGWRGELHVSPLVLLSGVPTRADRAPGGPRPCRAVAARGRGRGHATAGCDLSDASTAGCLTYEGGTARARAGRWRRSDGSTKRSWRWRSSLPARRAVAPSRPRPTTSLSHLYMESGDRPRPSNRRAASSRSCAGAIWTDRRMRSAAGDRDGRVLLRGDVGARDPHVPTRDREGRRARQPVAKASAYWNASMFEFMRGGSVEVAVPLAAKALRLPWSPPMRMAGWRRCARRWGGCSCVWIPL